MEKKRLILLGDKTLSGVERTLNGLFEQEGLAWICKDAGFDSWLRELMDPQSATNKDDAAALGFVLSPRILENHDRALESIDRILAVLASQMRNRVVLFSNVYPDPVTPQPLVSHAQSMCAAAEINSRLYAYSRQHSWFHVIDHMGLALTHGLRQLADPRYEAAAQMYISPAGSRLVARAWLRHLRAIVKPAAKVLVLDLDNTLWHGILGEDGSEGIAMSASGPGWAHRRLQEALLRLRSNGILLAVCSKNNPEEARQILAEHPDCLLRPSEFCAIEIGWGPKSESIRRMASRLQLGLDAFVFLDDSAFEREEVKQALPSVTVLDFPADPLQLIDVLTESCVFDSPRVTQEDRERSASYAAEAQRTELRESMSSSDDFFRSLGLKLQLFSAQAEHASRLHQLILKTNQFNLTSERLSADEFRDWLGRPDAIVLGMRVADSFGDSGITGLAMISGIGSPTLVVENFLLSCRVIGRTVEFAFLHWLAGYAASRQARRVVLKFRSTGRNQVASEFLGRSGLEKYPGGDDWGMDVSGETPSIAKHFVVIDDQKVMVQEVADAAG